MFDHTWKNEQFIAVIFSSMPAIAFMFGECICSDKFILQHLSKGSLEARFFLFLEQTGTPGINARKDLYLSSRASDVLAQSPG